MELDYSICFAEQYNFLPMDYSKIQVTTLPLHVRITNRLQSHSIMTLADLLEKTPNDLMRIRGFGEGCLLELDSVLKMFEDEVDTRVSKTMNTPDFLLQKYRHKIIAGDFTFLSDEDLGDSQLLVLNGAKEAYELLGNDLVNACVSKRPAIESIKSMFEQFSYCSKRFSEIISLIERIPPYRRKNMARGYINAFTHNENTRQIIESQYDSIDAPLDNFVGKDLEDYRVYTTIKAFYKWCAFNLRDDIAKLLSTFKKERRLQTIIEMRSRKATLEKCGNKLRLTRERIRQLEKNVLQLFTKYQYEVDLISKISAEKNGDTIILPADIERYCEDYSVELLYLLHNCKSRKFTYDEQLDAFFIGDDSLHDHVFAYVESLPDFFSIKKLSEYLDIANNEHSLPEPMVKMAILEAYRLSGEVYHRTRLSLTAIYESVLREHYSNGIKAYDLAELARFRSIVSEKYGGIKMSENDRALTASITRICTLCGKGKYKLKQKKYISPRLAKRIYEYIVLSEDNVFLLNTLFCVFEKELREAGVDNKYYLQGILHELYGNKLVFTKDYVSTNAGERSIYPSVIAYIETSRYPVSKAQIQNKFPGITDVVINFAVNNPSILNYFGEYFHTSKLRINPEEERYLHKVVRRVCTGGLPHHVKDVYELINQERPEILTRNAALIPFSVFSVLEYLLRDSFQFARPYIAMKGVEMGRPAERLHDFIYSMDEFSFNDISDFSKENRYVIQSQLDYVNSCNDKYLIVNDTTVRTIESIGVTEAIASAVELAVLEEVRTTMAISQLTCWGKFPTINVPWTDWLVYSVLNKWSKKLSVAPSSKQFRLSVPLVAPSGMLDLSRFSGVHKDSVNIDFQQHAVADDLENIDDVLVEMLGDSILEDDIWD